MERRIRISAAGDLVDVTSAPLKKNVYIDAALHEKLKQYAKGRGMSIANVTELAIDIFLSKPTTLIKTEVISDV